MKKLIIVLIVVACFESLCAQNSVEFQLTDFPVKTGFTIGIRGDTQPLTWENSIEMGLTDSLCMANVDFPNEADQIEFKFVLEDNKGNVIWETNENRTLKLLKDGKTISLNQWDVEPVIDISLLPKLQPQGLREDFELLKSMVLDVHPATYRYNDSISIQKALQDLDDKFQKQITYQDAYLAISKLLAQLQCDHTFASYYNQGNQIKSIIHKQKNKLPFAFKWIDKKMIMTFNATDNDQLKRGTEIVSINHIPAKDILVALLPYVSSDGANNKARTSKLEVEGYDFRYYDFDVFFPLVFSSVTDSLVLEIEQVGEEIIKTIVVEPQTLTERSQMLTERYPEFPKSKNDLWNFEITDDNIGILTLNSFGLMGWKSLSIDYKAFLANVFSDLKQNEVKDLIIDIRQNNGGNDEILQELMGYFDIERIKVENSEGRTRYNLFPSDLRNHINSWGDPWYYDLTNQNPTQREGYYIFPDAYTANIRNKKKKNYFKEKIYLLTSPANVSLAYYFAKNFKIEKLGLIVGEETGGNQQGINGGQILFLKLPYSGIEIDFPVIGEFSTFPLPNGGIKPDKEIQITQKDIALGIDKTLEYVQKEIKK